MCICLFEQDLVATPLFPLVPAVDALRRFLFDSIIIIICYTYLVRYVDALRRLYYYLLIRASRHLFSELGTSMRYVDSYFIILLLLLFATFI